MEQPWQQQIENLCQALYGGGPEAQKHAHETLLPLIAQPENAPQLQALLRSHNPHVVLFATSGLSQLMTTNWSKIPDLCKEDTRKFILNTLYQGADSFAMSTSSLLLGNFVRLLVRIVKLQWLENIANQNIVEQVSEFLKRSTTHWIVALTIFTELTQEMQPILGPNTSRQRRIATTFREAALPEIFKVALRTLEQFVNRSLPMSDPQEEHRFLRELLRLNNNCLSFDFQGIVYDDSTDDQPTVMIPQSWSFLRQQNMPLLFFTLYTRCWDMSDWTDCARQCLKCLVLVAAVKRTFFAKDEERLSHLGELVTGTTEIIRTKRGLCDDDCYHEVCRLLGKIEAANQLSDLSSSDTFATWIEEIFTFTLASLENWRKLPNSKHYLLNLWSNMVVPLLHMRERAPTNVASCIQQIVVAFIESRMRIAEAVGSEAGDVDLDDPLQNEVMRTEQLQVMSSLGKCRYRETAGHVAELFERARQDLSQNIVTEAVFQQKIMWLVYMIGSLIGAHTSKFQISRSMSSGGMDDESSPPHHAINGELASTVFKLMNETDRLPVVPEGLELAYLYFLEEFRKVYISEHAKHVMQIAVTERLASVLGLDDDNAVLGLVITKIGFNLHQRASYESVVRRSLQLFHDLASGINVVTSLDRMPQLIMSGRLMLENQTVKLLLEHHQSESFAFLHKPRYGKYRTQFYYTLGKLLAMGLRDSTEKFDSFMRPFSETLMALAAPRGCSEDAVVKALVGLLRDLRGVLQALNSPEHYRLFFAWILNNPKEPSESRLGIMKRVAKPFVPQHEVTTPMLRLLAELAHNRQQRVAFDHASPNGILLFRELSCTLAEFGPEILNRPPGNDLYREKYKPLAASLEMFSHALGGGYTNFGVFEVYQDEALTNALRLGLAMCLAIPRDDLSAYLKTLRQYYYFIELATRSFMPQVLELDPPALAQILMCIEDGLCALDPATRNEAAVGLQCCTTAENFVKFFHAHKNSNEREGQAVRRFLQGQPQSLPRLLQLMFQLVLSSSMTSTYTLAKPMLGLILLHEQEFVHIKESILHQHVPEKRTKLAKLFEDLMRGVDSQLASTTNKERFAQNLFNFVQHLRTATD